MKNAIDLPFRKGIPFKDQCHHGKLWAEDCIDCEIFSLRIGIEQDEQSLARDKARLARLLRATEAVTEVRDE